MKAVSYNKVHHEWIKQSLLKLESQIESARNKLLTASVKTGAYDDTEEELYNLNDTLQKGEAYLSAYEQTFEIN